MKKYIIKVANFSHKLSTIIVQNYEFEVYFWYLQVSTDPST